MRKNIKNIIGITTSLVLFSCNSFLDELPDNRTTLDNDEKIKRILVSAYPSINYALVAELSSDNIEDLGATNPNSDRFFEEVSYWKDTKEIRNDAVKYIWESHYEAIASANQALKAIEDLGNPANLNAFKGEALIARAYSHFVLVNLFSNHYNTQTSASDLGIPYMEKPETALSPKYERGTVKEVYEKINTDIETALPLIQDNVYSVPKYHFNRRAAYAFAARFNLYYEKWQKAATYAGEVLGSSPSTVVRNWQEFTSIPRTVNATVNHYVSSDKEANLLMQSATSNIGTTFGPYYVGARFNHTDMIASRETFSARGPWGTSNASTFWYAPYAYKLPNLNKTLFYKIPYLFVYTDIVTRTGLAKAVFVPFTTDETLLVRAEANIMLKNYADAVQDLNVWSKAMLRSGATFTQNQLETFYGDNLRYSTDEIITQKKKLNPKFTVETGTQENLLHCVLQYRRLLTLHEGLRWFDIRRYGIEVPRFQVQSTGGRMMKDKLTVNDLRRTLQIPDEVIKSGLTPNPR